VPGCTNNFFHYSVLECEQVGVRFVARACVVRLCVVVLFDFIVVIFLFGLAYFCLH
jgi:hypothetical protein